MNHANSFFRYKIYFDWITFGILFLLSFLSIAFVFSATTNGYSFFSIFFKKQLFGIVSGLGLYLICCLIDYRTVSRWCSPLYLLVIGLLIYTLIKGFIGMGAQRWINLFIFRFQPSELTKIFFPIFMVTNLEHLSTASHKNWTNFLPSLSMLIISTALIMKQPDLGTALIILFSGLVLLWFCGLDKRFYISLFCGLIIVSPFMYKSLKPYQKKRIAVFLGQGEYNKERYQLEQSKIAIGSGGFLGKGFLHGTQTHYNFLPESRNDFIFSVIAEEIGLIGALCILILYVLLFMRIIGALSHITNINAQLLGLGLIIPIILSALVNIAMVLGLVPVVGIPLPIMSSGITNLWITYISLGLIQSIITRQALLGHYITA